MYRSSRSLCPGITVAPCAWLLLALCSLPLAACGGEDAGGADAGGEEPRTITYYEDVKPIVDAKCAGCHYQGGIAPFALTSYEDVRTYAGASLVAIEAGTMPPWHASGECNDYHAVRALDDAHKTVFAEWVEAGLSQGDPASEGPALEVETTTLSRVDSTLTMPESYTPAPAAGRSDDYRCFILPWPETTTRYLTGFGFLPGNEAVAHHAIAFLAQPEHAATYQGLDDAEAGPGWTCFGGTGGPAREWIGAWAPGNQGADLPPGLGIEIQPGSLIILQMHYSTATKNGGVVEPDRTSLELKLDDQVQSVARILPWANPQWVQGDSMTIPANDPDVTHSFAFDPTIFPFSNADRVNVFHVGAHMHLLGKSARLSIERSDGTSTCLLQVDRWDFDWQGDYSLRAPQVVNKGDRLRIECHWDNSAENQPVVNGDRLPPQEVSWGEGTRDEMCLGISLVTAE